MNNFFGTLTKTFFVLLPKKTISFSVGKLFAVEFFSPLQVLINKVYLSIFKIDLQAFKQQQPQDYPSLASMFSREFASLSAPESKNPQVFSPAEGLVVSASPITHNQALQCKGDEYSVGEMLFGIKSDESIPESGCQSTIYLSPANYHRVHSPCKGILKSIRYIPGELIPVIPKCLHLFKGIFKRNERLVFEIKPEKSKGRIYVVMVGSINVGKMVSHFLPNFSANSQPFWSNSYSSNQQHWKINKKVIALDELGYFSFGSTVVIVADQIAAIDLGFSGFTLHEQISIGQKSTREKNLHQDSKKL